MKSKVLPERYTKTQAESDTPRVERRRTPRVMPDEKVSIEIYWSKDNLSHVSKPISALGIDISLRGVQVSLAFSIPVGFALDLLINFLERNEQFMVSGTVAWAGRVEGTSQYRMGVNICEVSVRDSSRWDNLFPS